MSSGQSDGRRGVPAERNGRRPAVHQNHVLPFWDIGGGAYFGYRMAIAARLFDRRIAQILAGHGGLTLPQWRVLAQLGLMGTGTVRSLADGAVVDRSEASRALKDLEGRSYVARSENPQDRRSPTFSLTEQGMKQFEITRRPISRFIQDLAKGTTDEDMKAANRVLWTVTQGCLEEPR
ncbi:MarR family winged helix-turn-helix transcriptional regulator [Sphingosinicella sp. CPCC 101087]|uniref:MarR family winged helix-turn-helix transcriptional regulator n=1 Tax=Sphingosinicella sp. CPCC 101087 TaxID=2497754 RepID=UPI00101C8BBE|nr:MarR family winged helix-turn-helix transcriptional regulator [Sphingosinicella sp. CPCC 101087]